MTKPNKEEIKKYFISYKFQINANSWGFGTTEVERDKGIESIEDIKECEGLIIKNLILSQVGDGDHVKCTIDNFIELKGG